MVYVVENLARRSTQRGHAIGRAIVSEKNPGAIRRETRRVIVGAGSESSFTTAFELLEPDAECAVPPGHEGDSSSVRRDTRPIIVAGKSEIAQRNRRWRRLWPQPENEHSAQHHRANKKHRGNQPLRTLGSSRSLRNLRRGRSLGQMIADASQIPRQIAGGGIPIVRVLGQAAF